MPAIALNRKASLVLAIVLAALATIVLSGYVRGLERQALGRGESTEVLVAKNVIPAGTSASAAMRGGLMGRQVIPSRAVVDGSIAGLDEIEGKVAGADILKGEQIVKARFVSPEQAASAFVIPADRQAMAVEVGAPHGVAGFVQPGNHVSIIARAASGQDTKVQYLMQGIEVLAVGQRVKGDDGGNGRETPATSPAGKVLLTLAVTPVEAEKLAYAVIEGEVWFTLLPPGQQVQTTSGRAAANLFS